MSSRLLSDAEARGLGVFTPKEWRGARKAAADAADKEERRLALLAMKTGRRPLARWAA